MLEEATELPIGTPVLIGIGGGTGSGKTTVARKIVKNLPHTRAVMLQHDWYYKDQSQIPFEERVGLNFDQPDALDNELLVKHLTALKKGEPVACPQYDFATHIRLPAVLQIDSHPIIVVEGILLFAVAAVRELFDLRLFIDTDDDIRLMRRIKRDIIERGRDILNIQRQYYSTVRPMHQAHVAPTKQFAHLVIPEGGENRIAVDVIVGRLLYTLWRMNALMPKSGALS